MKKLLSLILALCLVLGMAVTASADTGKTVDWPKKNITIIVGFGAGGDTDLGARILADALSSKLGVSVVVENLAGGTGVVGRTEMLSRESHGYTLMFDQQGSPITQVLLGNSTYELEEAGIPVSVVGIASLALCVAKDNAKGIKTMEDFIAYAEEHPGELTYAIPGQFTAAHLAALSAFTSLGINVTSVPTDGTATCVTEVLGKHVDALCVPFSGAMQYVQSGDMILLGLSAPSVFAEEDAPVLSDFGAKEYNTWYCLWTDTGTDPAVVEILDNAVAECLQDEDVVKSLTDLGIQVAYENAEESLATVEAYRDIIRDALITGGATVVK